VQTAWTTTFKTVQRKVRYQSDHHSVTLAW